MKALVGRTAGLSKELSGHEPGFARVSGREAKIDLLLGLWERLLSWGRDQGLCMDNVEVPVVGRGYHTWSRQILAMRDAASPPSFTHLPARKAEPPAPPPPSPAFLFEQVAFENFKHTLLFPRCAAQQFRLCS